MHAFLLLSPRRFANSDFSTHTNKFQIACNLAAFEKNEWLGKNGNGDMNLGHTLAVAIASAEDEHAERNMRRGRLCFNKNEFNRKHNT